MTIKPYLVILIGVLLSALLLTGCATAGNDPLQGKIYTYSGTGKGEEAQQPVTTPTATQPALQQNETTERHITITESNSVFSIGVPKGYREERQVTAEKPVDFWFEYISQGIVLNVDGTNIEIPERRTTSKIGYKSSVTSFNYTLYNPTSEYISYNLRMTPSKAGDSVPAMTREKWVAP